MKKLKMLFCRIQYIFIAISRHKKENIYTLTYTTDGKPVSLYRYVWETSKLFK